MAELGALWRSEEAAALMRKGQRAAATSDKPSASGRLTPREIEVLKLVAAGLSNRTIGRKLFVSDLTVKRHVANVLAKLELPSRAAAAAYAAKTGLV